MKPIPHSTTTTATTTTDGSDSPAQFSTKWRKEIPLVLLLVAAVVIHLYLQLGGGGSGSTTARDAASFERKQIGFGKNQPILSLSCEKFGGPSEEIAAEMVYWRQKPSNTNYTSPFRGVSNSTKYLTFTPGGGWNNVRMGIETTVAMAIAMGRTLVMPPVQTIYLLEKGDNGQKNQFDFTDFYNFTSIQQHSGLQVITMEEFLRREALTGNLVHTQSKRVSFPPGNVTSWDRSTRLEVLSRWLTDVTTRSPWFFDNCMLVFPAEAGAEASTRLKLSLEAVWNESVPEALRIQSYTGRPTPVDGPTKLRFQEMIAHRKRLCMYDETMQEAKVLHFLAYPMRIHFYAFLFFEDWKQDLWMKRFVRDQVRYLDQVQCAAARVVNALREKARENGNERGVFDSMHIRRGDFEGHRLGMIVSSNVIFNNIHDVLEPNSTIYVSTDEQNRDFFDIFRQNYHLYFLDDFVHLLENVNTNFYGLVEQRIASRGRTFVAAYGSSYSDFIDRMIGYHSQVEKTDGYETGKISSYFYAPKDVKYAYREYRSVSFPLYAREFPVGWRDIDRE